MAVLNVIKPQFCCSELSSLVWDLLGDSKNKVVRVYDQSRQYQTIMKIGGGWFF